MEEDIETKVGLCHSHVWAIFVQGVIEIGSAVFARLNHTPSHF